MAAARSLFIAAGYAAVRRECHTPLAVARTTCLLLRGLRACIAALLATGRGTAPCLV